MSTDAAILWLWGGLIAAFLLCFVVAEVHFLWRCWTDRRRLPATLARLDQEAETLAALRALTSGDRAWLTTRGWRP